MATKGQNYLRTPTARATNEGMNIILNHDWRTQMCIAEIIVGGYDITYNTDTHYTGTTRYVSLSQFPNRYDFVFKAEELLPSPPKDWSDFAFWGIDAMTRATAKVNFYDYPYDLTNGFQYDEQGYITNFNPQAEGVSLYGSTGSVAVNILLFGDNSFRIEPIEDCTASILDFQFAYDNHACTNLGGDNVYVYAYEIYDIEDTLVYKSGDLFNWATVNKTHTIRVNNLSNGDYYIKAELGLSNGYILSATSNVFNVNINPQIDISDRVELINNASKGRIELSFNGEGLGNYNQIIITRSKWGTNEWLELKKENISLSTIRYKDYYTSAGIRYIYRVTVRNGDSVVGIYENEITHAFDGVCIADKYGHYCTEVELEQYPVSKNERVFTQELLNSKFPVAHNHSDADYFRGSTSAVFTPIDDECNYDLEDKTENHSYRLELLNWLNNAQLKFLKFGNGYSFIVVITGSPSLEKGETEGSIKLNFEWVEVVDKDKLSNYSNFGLL